MKKQNLTVFLLAALAFTVISCGENAQTPPDAVTDESQETAAVKEAEVPDPAKRYQVADSLPETDLGGYHFRIFVEESYADMVAYTEQDGEVVNDAVYRANLNVSERFNVVIEPLAQSISDMEMMALIRSTLLANEDAFDITFGHDITMANASLEGLFVNLRDIGCLDFEKPWWPDTVDSLTINGKYYLGTSSVSYLNMHWTKCLFVDKKKLISYDITMPYQEVLDGKWTFERLMELTSDVTEDVDGDGKMTDQDFYGYATSKAFSGYTDLCGIETIAHDTDGTITLTLNTPHTQDVIDRLGTWILDKPGSYITDNYPIEFFNEGHALFAYLRLGDAIDTFRHGNIDYGILPMPKYDAEQEHYISSYFDRLFAIPVTEPDIGSAGLILEAMSAEGYRTVTPAYFEIALKNKLTIDPDGVAMLDVIMQHRIMDFSYVYGYGTNMNNILAQTLGKNTRDFSSYYARNERAALKYVDKINKTFEELE